MNALLSRNYSRARSRTAPNRMSEARVADAAKLVGAHVAYLAGIDTVSAMIKDEAFVRFIRRAIFEEVLPLIAAPEKAKRAYAEQVLSALRQSRAETELTWIATNPVSRWRASVLPSLLDYYRSRGTIPPALAFSLAALVSFCRGRAVAPGELDGRRAGQAYAVRDEENALTFFSDAWADHGMNGDWYALAYATLRQDGVWGEDLSRIRGLVGTLAQDLATIATSGARAAVASFNALPR